jgi:AICAR transformylase/IMP cyclohydrolase PurH
MATTPGLIIHEKPPAYENGFTLSEHISQTLAQRSDLVGKVFRATSNAPSAIRSFATRMYERFNEMEYTLEAKAVELMSGLKYALNVEPDERYNFARHLQDASFAVAVADGRKCVNEADVVWAYTDMYR